VGHRLQVSPAQLPHAYVRDSLLAGASGFLLKDVPADRLVEGLTGREREVFARLARGRSNAEIAADLVISHETAKSHVAEVLRKLGLRDRIQAVVFAHDHGLIEAP
jgi:DNA-binding NarL/FixJ family response regulator